MNSLYVLYAAVAFVIGFQSVLFAVLTKVFAIAEGFLPVDPRLTKLFHVITLEVGLVVGAILIVLGLAGKTNEAIRSLEAAVWLNPEDGEAWARLGILYVEVGKVEDARGSLEQARKIDPQNRLVPSLSRALEEWGGRAK